MRAAGLTVTAERQEQVVFTDPYITNVRELVVTGPTASGLATLGDLAGRGVVVRAGSGYATHLRGLGRQWNRGPIGRETVDYVANINKYYLAYRLQNAAGRARQAARTST